LALCSGGFTYKQKKQCLGAPGLKGPLKLIKINFKKGKKCKMIGPLVKMEYWAPQAQLLGASLDLNLALARCTCTDPGRIVCIGPQLVSYTNRRVVNASENEYDAYCKQSRKNPIQWKTPKTIQEPKVSIRAPFRSIWVN